MKTIGLCMIVKNERDVIGRCLESVRPLVDYVLVEDTGSSDGTQETIRKYLQETGLRGEVVDRPWKDFASNRSSVLARLREQTWIDYALMMDADDVLALPANFNAKSFKDGLSVEIYNLWMRLGPVTYHRPQICSNRVAFRYRGVLHEFLEGPAPEYRATQRDAGLTIICNQQQGARSHASDKYEKDAMLLEGALEVEKDSMLASRYTFYLAQSYRDAGDKERALTRYLERATQGYWSEEIYISLYEAAKLKSELNHPGHEVVGLFLKAHEVSPGRGEALHGAMRYCRNRNLFHQGYLIGKHAVTLKRPAEGLFLEDWIYDYGLFDEFAVLAYWAGAYRECKTYADRLLAEGKLPWSEQARVKENARFAAERMKEMVTPAGQPAASRVRTMSLFSARPMPARR